MARQATGPLAPKDIDERFAEAARTLRRLPDEKPQGYFNTWPAIVRTRWEIMAMQPQPMRFSASPRAIDNMDECFGWLFWLEADEARVVWMRAEGMRWKPICRQLGIGRATAWRWWMTALIKISHRLAVDDRARLAKARKRTS